MTTALVIVVFNLYFAALAICSHFLFIALDFNRHVSFKNKMFIYFSVFCHFEFCLSMMMFLSCGYYQLSALNDHLRKSLRSQIKFPVPDVIRKTRMMYDKLCDVFESISVFYLISNLVFLMGLTYFNICFYYSIYVFSKNPSYELGYFTLTTYCWCMYFTPCIIWITIFSSWIELEGKKTADLVQRLANKDKHLKSLTSSNLMMLLTAHRKPRIFCGLYDFNWKGFFAMICSIFSLCIIVIQFYDVTI